MNKSLSLLIPLLEESVLTFQSFDSVRLFDHQNEILCFISLDDRSVSEEKFIYSQNVYRLCEDKIKITLLSSQNGSAREIEELSDSDIIPKLKASGLKIKKLTFSNSGFSKTHLRFKLDIFLTVEESERLDNEIPLSFSIDTVPINYFLDYELELENDFYKKHTVAGNMINSLRTQKPRKLRLISHFNNEEAASAFEYLSSYSVGIRILSLCSVDYYSMVMSKLEARPIGNGLIKIVCEFTEVSG